MEIIILIQRGCINGITRTNIKPLKKKVKI